MLSNTLIHELLTVNITVNKFIVTPIGQPLENQKYENAGRRDYDIEMEFAKRGQQILWDEPENGHGAVVGDIFGFLHKTIGPDGGTVEIHKVLDIKDHSFRRSHWDQNNRRVIFLSPKIDSCSYKDFCQLIVNQKYLGVNGNITRIAGTVRKNWNKNFPNSLTSVYQPGIPAVWPHAAKQSTLEICRQIAGDEFKNTLSGAAKTLDALFDPESRNQVIVTANLQAGKTGIQILIAKAFEKMSPHAGSVGVIQITCKSLTDIHNQTMKRFKSAGFNLQLTANDSEYRLFETESSKIALCHVMLSSNAFSLKDGEQVGKLSEALSLLKNIGCKQFLFILDEAHVATNIDQQLDNFLKNNDICPLSDGHYDPPVYFVAVTATPIRDFVMPICHGGKLWIVYAEPGEGYYGINEMLQSNRIYNFIEAKHEDDLDKALQLCQPGHVILRIAVNNKLNLEAIAARHGRILKQINSAKGNINLLDEILQSKPAQDTLIIIKDAMGAGVTLSTVKYIGGWIEVRYKDFEIQVQSAIGRSSGYSIDRREATFPIFTDKIQAEYYAQSMNFISKGIVPKHRLKHQEDQWSVNGTPEYKVMTYEQYVEWCDKIQIDHSKRMRLWFDKNIKRNMAQNLLADKSTSALGRFMAIKDLNNISADIQKLITQFPELQEKDKGLVIVNIVKGKRPKPTTTFNKK